VALALETFPNTSVDLIYARPGQTLSAWEKELTAALDFGAPHLSLYELTIEERTAFGRRAARGELVPMDEDGQADLYELTQQVCESAGLPAYEISNHARAPELQSQHNQINWNSGDWIGVGPGAHGRLTYGTGRNATVCHRRPADYIAAACHGRVGWAETERLGEAEIGQEFLAMGLRVAKGLDMARLERLTGPLDTARLAQLEEAGLLSRDKGRLALTPQGRLLADHVAAQLSK
jgi:oxygen-independent coproporphyrinogen-3 oxidase